MRLVTWNVAGRVTRHAEQAAAVAEVGADVVCLQEVTARTLPLWRAALAEQGLEHTVTPLDWYLPPKPRRLGVLTAAREPLDEREQPKGLPWPERVAVASLGDVEVVNVHSPISPSPELAKVITHEVLAARVREGGGPLIVCGDLNTPRREHGPGDLLTFAHDSRGNLRPQRGERWDAAERALVADAGLVDVFRTLHGYAERSASWTYPHNRGGYRLDHVLVRGLEPVAASYVHEWRTSGLSDHSGLVVDLAPE